jgi:murein L,D-transpeptidase YafK
MPVRALVATAATAASLALAGCDGESLSTNAKANKPIPEKLVAEMDAKNMDKASPMLVRLFKQEAELEIWKQDRNGQFALLKTYPICRWSGDLGPKIREGDRQAPEGFYTITPGQMNPQSAYYLSFNMGYPNAFDKALGRTGSQLMVHGDCSSRGCYAMTDEQISEIYSLGREAFFGGQRGFQVQAYPFRMTPANFARHRDNPNMPFWKMLKEGNDHFEVSRQEPKVDVCEKRYVFDAQAPAGSTRPLTFNPAGACPAYQIAPELAEAVRDKQQADDTKTAELISRGTPVAKRNTGIDGGMHAVFAAKVPNASTGLSDPVAPNYSLASYSALPGTIPQTVNPPRSPEPVFSLADPYSSPAVPSADSVPAAPRVAAAPAEQPTGSAGGSASGSKGFFNNLAQKVGLKKDEPAAVAAAKPVPPKPPAVITAAKPQPKPADVRPAEVKSAAAAPAAKPVAQAVAPMPAPAAARPAPDQTIAGAQPVLPSSSFESRWSSFR